MSAIRCVFVTGHEFGMSALTGLYRASRTVAPQVEIALVLTLSSKHCTETVGYADGSSDRFPDLEVRTALDRRLRADKSMIQDAAPSFLIVVGWSRLVPPEILDLPAQANGYEVRHGLGHGAIGMHPTLLPTGRGRAPLPWTLIKGLRKTGLSVFRLEEQADSGDIILQLPLDVADDETATTLFTRFQALHEAAGFELALRIAAKSVDARPQHHQSATLWPTRRSADSELDFTWPRADAYKLIRAQAFPYPAAYIDCRSGRLYVHAAVCEKRLSPIGPAVLPGRVTSVDQGCPIVECGDGEMISLRKLSWSHTGSLEWIVGELLSMH